MIELYGELNKESCDYTFQNFDFETALDILFDAAKRKVYADIEYSLRMNKMSEDLKTSGYIWYDTTAYDNYVPFIDLSPEKLKEIKNCNLLKDN